MAQRITVRSRELVSSHRTDRPDGYDWQTVLRFTYSDDSVSEWASSGTLTRRQDGIDWHIDINIQNPPGGATAQRVTRSIEAKITYAAPGAQPAEPGKRPATVELTHVNGEGERRTSTFTRMVSESTPEEPSLNEMLSSVQVDPKVNLPFPTIRHNDPGNNPGDNPGPSPGGSTTVTPMLPFWFCTESCASGCLWAIETPIGYEVCIDVCMAACLAD